jgi:hypothetical protein
LTHDDFAGRVGERFALCSADQSRIDLRLIEVTESQELGGPGPQGQERRQFSLVFRGPASPVQPQSIYHLDHDGLGELEIFLVPIGPDNEGMCYEAVFA